MKIVYTKHAQNKLKRKDIEEFGINKKKIEEILRSPESETETKYGDRAALSTIDKGHDLRVIYDIINSDMKVITFHIARKGRYK